VLAYEFVTAARSIHLPLVKLRVGNA